MIGAISLITVQYSIPHNPGAEQSMGVPFTARISPVGIESSSVGV